MGSTTTHNGAKIKELFEETSSKFSRLAQAFHDEVETVDTACFWNCRGSDARGDLGHEDGSASQPELSGRSALLR